MPIRYRIDNVVVADPPLEPSVQLTRAVAVPARVFERLLQVHDTLPRPSAAPLSRDRSDLEPGIHLRGSHPST